MKISKAQFLVAVSLASVLVALPQANAADPKPDESYHFGIGLHGGANFNDLKIEQTGAATITAAKENRTGLLLGAHLEFGSEMVVLRPEVNYSVRGYRYVNIVEVNQKYLEIPVLVRVNFLPGMLQPFAEIGPQLGIHLSDDINALGGTLTVNDDSKSIDFSGVVGAGMRVSVIPNFSIDGEARYVFGFTDHSSNDNIEVKTRGFQVLAGVTMRY